MRLRDTSVSHPRCIVNVFFMLNFFLAIIALMGKFNLWQLISRPVAGIVGDNGATRGYVHSAGFPTRHGRIRDNHNQIVRIRARFWIWICVSCEDWKMKRGNSLEKY